MQNIIKKNLSIGFFSLPLVGLTGCNSMLKSMEYCDNTALPNNQTFTPVDAIALKQDTRPTANKPLGTTKDPQSIQATDAWLVENMHKMFNYLFPDSEYTDSQKNSTIHNVVDIVKDLFKNNQIVSYMYNSLDKNQKEQVARAQVYLKFGMLVYKTAIYIALNPEEVGREAWKYVNNPKKKQMIQHAPELLKYTTYNQTIFKKIEYLVNNNVLHLGDVHNIIGYKHTDEHVSKYNGFKECDGFMEPKERQDKNLIRNSDLEAPEMQNLLEDSLKEEIEQKSSLERKKTDQVTKTPLSTPSQKIESSLEGKPKTRTKRDQKEIGKVITDKKNPTKLVNQRSSSSWYNMFQKGVKVFLDSKQWCGRVTNYTPSESR